VRLPERAGYAEFAAAIPAMDYEDVRPWIDQQARTGVPTLTVETPVVYERTSGSSGRAKLIPYTPSLLASFGGCFEIWAHDLVAHGPPFCTGQMFFSASPALQDGERTECGVPISLADDAAYLPTRHQRLLSGSFVVPPALKSIRSDAEFRRALAATLVAAARLETISVWSPTYLLAILDSIGSRRIDIMADLQRGRTGPPGQEFPLPPTSPRRIGLLAHDPIPWEQVWPHLKLLSCWTDAASAGFVADLRKAFPATMLQGKGLLATEAPMTVPLVHAPAPVPLLDEVFFEFTTSSGTICRLHELEDGREYGVVVSQCGGLLRYRMRDRIRTEGRVGETPCLRFLGREDRGSDLVGEKLGEPFVRSVLTAVFGESGHCSFLVATRVGSGTVAYRCVSDHPRAAEDAAAVAQQIDANLARSFHYRQALRVGQLGPVAVDYRPDARSTWEAIHLGRGLQWGDIKFESILPQPVSVSNSGALEFPSAHAPR
jgi:hypothetical protein